MNPDRLAELEEERRFLLGSLDDLEREYAAGDVDDDDYRTLRDGYTVRAASVLRAIEAGRVAAPAGPRRRPWRLVGGVLAVLAIAVTAGVLVARSSGQRLPGQEITGGIPGDISTTLAQARSVLGSDPVTAQSLYTDVLSVRPDHPEALAYSGWLLAINSIGANEDLRALALETSTRSLRRSIESDPDYADPHCFLAIIAANFQDDPETADAEARACLDKDPPADMRGLLEVFVFAEPEPAASVDD